MMRARRRSFGFTLLELIIVLVLMTVIGGREVHPVNMRVGGFHRVIRKAELAPVDVGRMLATLVEMHEAMLEEGGVRLTLAKRIRARISY